MQDFARSAERVLARYDFLSAGMGALVVTGFCVSRGQDVGTALWITAAATVGEHPPASLSVLGCDVLAGSQSQAFPSRLQAELPNSGWASLLTAGTSRMLAIRRLSCWLQPAPAPGSLPPLPQSPCW